MQTHQQGTEKRSGGLWKICSWSLSDTFNNTAIIHNSAEHLADFKSLRGLPPAYFQQKNNLPTALHFYIGTWSIAGEAEGNYGTADSGWTAIRCVLSLAYSAIRRHCSCLCLHWGTWGGRLLCHLHASLCLLPLILDPEGSQLQKSFSNNGCSCPGLLPDMEGSQIKRKEWHVSACDLLR